MQSIAMFIMMSAMFVVLVAMPCTSVTAAPVDMRNKSWSSVRVIAAIPWRIKTQVPTVLNKKDRVIAGIVVAAVLWPILIIHRWHAQIYRWVVSARRRSLNDDWRCVNNRGLGVVD